MRAVEGKKKTPISKFVILFQTRYYARSLSFHIRQIRFLPCSRVRCTQGGRTTVSQRRKSASVIAPCRSPAVSSILFRPAVVRPLRSTGEEDTCAVVLEMRGDLDNQKASVHRDKKDRPQTRQATTRYIENKRRSKESAVQGCCFRRRCLLCRPPADSPKRRKEPDWGSPAGKRWGDGGS